MKTFILASLLLPAMVTMTAARAEEPPAGPWQFVKQTDGIVVERRVVSGSNLKEFRGRGVVDAPIAHILGVFSDVPRATEWMDSCSGSRALSDVGEREKIVYNRTHAPWPVADRDVVLHNIASFDEAQRQVRLDFWSVADPQAPPVAGVVRMPFVRGHWILTPAGDGSSTRVEYQVHANPGGRLPDWLVNYVSRDLPFRTITGLRAQVKRRSYPDFERALRARFAYPFLWPPTPAPTPNR